MDAHKNFAVSTVLVAPTPADSGVSITLATGGGALMPAVPFNGTVWPIGIAPTAANAEIVRVTARSGDDLTIVRAQELSSARTIVAGDQFAATITTKTITDIESPVLELANGAGFTISIGRPVCLRPGIDGIGPLTFARAANTWQGHDAAAISALGDSYTFAQNVGILIDTAVVNGATGRVQIAGVVTLTTAQWDGVVVDNASGDGLTPGARYYLYTAGRLTTQLFDSNFGNRLVGVALSPTQMLLYPGGIEENAGFLSVFIGQNFAGQTLLDILTPTFDQVSALSAAVSVLQAGGGTASATSVELATETSNRISADHVLSSTLQLAVDSLSDVVSVQRNSLSNAISTALAVANAASNAASAVSQSLSAQAAALSIRIDTQSNAISVLSQAASVLSQAHSVLSQSVSVQAAALSVRIDTQSQTVSVLSQAVSVLSVKVDKEISDRVSAGILMQARFDSLSLLLGSALQDASVMSVRIGTLSSQVSTVSVAVTSVDTRVNTVSNQVSILSQQVSVLSQAVSVLNAVSARTTAATSVKGLQSIINALSGRISALTGGGVASVTSNEASAISAQAQSAINVVSNAVSVLSQSVSVLSQAVSVLSQSVSVLSQQHSALSQQVSALSSQVSVVSVAVTSVDTRVNTVSNQVSILSQQVSVLSQQISVVSNAVSVLSQANSVQQAALSLRIDTVSQQVSVLSQAWSVLSAVSARTTAATSVKGLQSIINALSSRISAVVAGAASVTSTELSANSAQAASALSDAISVGTATANALSNAISALSLAASPRRVVLAAAATVSAAAMTNVTGMSISVNAGETVQFKAFMFVNRGTAATVYGYGFTFPKMTRVRGKIVTPVSVLQGGLAVLSDIPFINSFNGDSASGSILVSTISMALLSVFVEIDAVMVVSTAGVIQMQVKAAATTGAAIILAGSYMQVLKIG